MRVASVTAARGCIGLSFSVRALKDPSKEGLGNTEILKESLN